MSIKVSDDVLTMAKDVKAELRQGLLELCIRSGFLMMAEMLNEEIVGLCGGRYEHGVARQAYRWGTTGGEVVLGWS